MSGRRGDRSRVLIPAARFSEAWGNFFGEKRFAKIAGFERFGSSRGVRSGVLRGLTRIFSFCWRELSES